MAHVWSNYEARRSPDDTQPERRGINSIQLFRHRDQDPDVEDNPNFPGWYSGGCLLYLADQAFARNKAVPLFERGLRNELKAQVRFDYAPGGLVCTLDAPLSLAEWFPARPYTSSATYLREMGAVPLLTREGEVDLALAPLHRLADQLVGFQENNSAKVK